MLKTLELKNVALIDRATIEFGEGLNVLSGETGSGKSVILDALNFVLGAKADKSIILLERHIKARYVSMQNLIISSVNIPVDWLMPLPL